MPMRYDSNLQLIFYRFNMSMPGTMIATLHINGLQALESYYDVLFVYRKGYFFFMETI